MSDVAMVIQDYRTAWCEAGHTGDGDVVLRLPIYVANTMEKALAEPMDSTMHHYNRLRQALQRSAGAADGGVRATRADRLATLTYDDVVQERVVFGTPEHVAKRLQSLQETLGLSGFIMESNVGGRIPPESVLQSIRLFGQEVVPCLRTAAD
jgi:alkanesulfonate monooxygenase SsuD/methylene tetrahydromethanopterin reductase-like flavin-dependent oxidoreductase (luciferase family)